MRVIASTDGRLELKGLSLWSGATDDGLWNTNRKFWQKIVYFCFYWYSTLHSERPFSSKKKRAKVKKKERMKRNRTIKLILFTNRNKRSKLNVQTQDSFLNAQKQYTETEAIIEQD